MTSLKIIGVFGLASALMVLIVFAFPFSYASREELADVNREAKADRLTLPCPRHVGPMITYGPACK
jgi:hypothetical protein